MKEKTQGGEDRNEIASHLPEAFQNPVFLPFSLSFSELIGILLDMSLPYKVIVLGVFSRPKSRQSL